MIRKLMWVLTITFIVALVATGCGGRKATPTPAPAPAGASSEMIAQGKQWYEQSCSSCHGPDAKGLPHLGKDMTTSEFIKGQTDEELLEFIKKGRPASDPANTTGVDMPPKGGNPALTDDQIRAIIAYIRSLQK
ncbi:MAG: cytochrome c [Anaerolineae bacterium]|nr:cytochrome c [Anaerolineae bacterium]MDW8098658.1 cytochrome c [Anaerolineae bacterium]